MTRKIKKFMENNIIENIVNHYDNIISQLLKGQNHLAHYPQQSIDTISKEHDTLTDLLLHTTLLLLDISVGSKYCLINTTTHHQFEANYFARSLAVHISEILKPDKSGIASRINVITKKYKDEDKIKDLIARLGQERKKIIRATALHFVYLNEIRKNIFAHKLGKGIEKSAMITDIDVDKIIEISREIHNSLVSISVEILVEIINRFLSFRDV